MLARTRAWLTDTAVALCVLAFASCAARAQAPVAIKITPPPVVLDRADHVDLIVHGDTLNATRYLGTLAIHADGTSLGVKAKWRSTNAGAASVVTGGRVTAKGEGTSKIIASVTLADGTVLADTILACVADWAKPAPTVRPATGRWLGATTVQYVAYRASGAAWPPACVHWSVSDTLIGRIDQWGVLWTRERYGTVPDSVTAKVRATIGVTEAVP